MTTKTKFFSSSLLKLDDLENEINKFCEGKEVVNIFFQEIAELAVVLVVWREVKE